MKTILLVLTVTTIIMANYFVAPDGQGNNADDGAIETPFATRRLLAPQSRDSYQVT